MLTEYRELSALLFFKLFTITAINLLSTLWLIAKAEVIEFFLFSLLVTTLSFSFFSPFTSIPGCLLQSLD